GTKVAFRGGEHIPRTGGALLAINHVSFADPIFDVAFTICHGRMPRFLAKSELWSTPVVRNVLAGGGHIPVYRASVRAKDAYRDAIAAIERGEIVVLYPEGTNTADPDGRPMKAKNGIGRIALLTGAPAIPAANWRTQALLRQPAHPHRPRRRHRQDHGRGDEAGGRHPGGDPAGGPAGPGEADGAGGGRAPRELTPRCWASGMRLS